MSSKFEFNAFISYSHAANSKLAASLQKGLERLARPLFKVRAIRLFRDETNLTATAHLWNRIEGALSRSEFFILLASPKAAASPWVLKEIEHRLAHFPIDTFLIGVTEGTIEWDNAANDFDWDKTTCVPRSLSRKFNQEPLWVDFRGIVDETSMSLNNPQFKNQLAAFSSAIRGIEKDDLISEDVRLTRRLKRLRILAIGALAALTAISIFLAILANRQTGIAKEKSEIANSEAEKARIEKERADSNAGVARSEADKAKREEMRADSNANNAMLQAAFAREMECQALDSAEYARRQRKIAMDRGDDLKKRAISASLVNLALVVREMDMTRAMRILEMALTYSDDRFSKRLMYDIYGKFSFYSQKRTLDRQLLNLTYCTPLKCFLVSKGDKIFTLNKAGDLIREFNGHRKSVNGICVAPSGEFFVSSGHDGQILRWDFQDPNDQPKSTEVEGQVYSIAISPHNMIAIGTHHGKIFLFDESLNLIREIATGQGIVSSLSFTQSGTRIVSASAITPFFSSKLFGNICWDTTGKELFRMDPGNSTFAVDCDPDGEYIMTAGEESQINIWEMATGKFVRNLSRPGINVRKAKFSPDGSFIVSVSLDNSLFLWTRDGKFLREYKGHSRQLQEIDFDFTSSPYEFVSLGHSDHSIYFWDYSLYVPLVSYSDLATFHTAVNDNGTFALSGGWPDDGKSGHVVTIFDIRARKAIRKLVYKTVDDLGFIMDDQYVVRSQKKLESRTIANDRHVFSFPECETFSIDRSTRDCMVLSGNGNLYRYTPGSSDSILWGNVGEVPNIDCIAYNQGRELVAFGTDQGEVKFKWKQDSTKAQGIVHKGRISNLQWTADGRTLLSSDYERFICLWDCYGNLLKRIEIDKLHRATISPDGEIIMVSFGFKKMCYLDKNGILIFEEEGNPDDTFVANFSHNGAFTIVGSQSSSPNTRVCVLKSLPALSSFLNSNHLAPISDLLEVQSLVDSVSR